MCAPDDAPPTGRTSFRRVALLATATAALAGPVSGCGHEERVRLIDTLSTPGTVAVGEGSVWVGTGDGVLKLDSSGDRKDDIQVGEVAALAVGMGGVWVVRAEDGWAVRIDPRSGDVHHGRRRVGVIESIGPPPLAAGLGSVWFGTEDSIIRIDPRTARRTGKPIEVGGSPDAIALAGGKLWVLIGTGTKRVRHTSVLPNEVGSVLPPDKELEAEPARDNTLVRIDPRRGRVEARLKPGSDPRDMAADRRGLWITDIEGLVRLDVESGRERRHTTLEEGPNGIAIGEGSIWLTDASQNTVIEADPSNGKVVGLPVEVPSETEGVSGEVGDIAAGEGAVWVGNETAPKLARIRP